MIEERPLLGLDRIGRYAGAIEIKQHGRGLRLVETAIGRAHDPHRPFVPHIGRLLRIGLGFGHVEKAFAEIELRNLIAGATLHYEAQHRHGLVAFAFQAQALLRTLALSYATDIPSLVAWYELKDPSSSAAVIGDENNRHLGVSFADYRPKPARAALQFFARLFRAGYRPLDGAASFAAVPAPGRTASAPVQVHAFLLADGSAALVAWIPTHLGGPRQTPATTDQAAAGEGDAGDARQTQLSVWLPCPDGQMAVARDEAGRIEGNLPAVRVRSGLQLGPFPLDGGVTLVATIPHCAGAPAAAN